MNTGHYDDMQSAPRFPLHLAASVKAQGSAYSAETENISANGVLFAMDSDVPVGSLVDFTIMLPAEVLGGRQNMQIDCRGRVASRIAAGAALASSSTNIISNERRKEWLPFLLA